MISPVDQWKPGIGAVITGTGGVLPAVIVTEARLEAPWESVTRTQTVSTPGWVKVWDTVGVVASPKTPSSSRSHENETFFPSSGSLDAEASSWTVSGAVPFVGVAETTALGGWLPAKYEIRKTFPSTWAT